MTYPADFQCYGPPWLIAEIIENLHTTKSFDYESVDTSWEDYLVAVILISNQYEDLSAPNVEIECSYNQNNSELVLQQWGWRKQRNLGDKWQILKTNSYNLNDSEDTDALEEYLASVVKDKHVKFQYSPKSSS